MVVYSMQDPTLCSNDSLHMVEFCRWALIDGTRNPDDINVSDLGVEVESLYLKTSKYPNYVLQLGSNYFEIGLPFIIHACSNILGILIHFKGNILFLNYRYHAHNILR
jgi:hypothetical protein